MYIYFRKDTRAFSHVSTTPNGGDWLLEFQGDNIRFGYAYTLTEAEEIIEGDAILESPHQAFDLEAFELQALRRLRDQKLAETDWMATVDSPAFSPEVAAYRQALRDITKEYRSVADAVWPELKPKAKTA